MQELLLHMHAHWHEDLTTSSCWETISARLCLLPVDLSIFWADSPVGQLGPQVPGSHC